MAQEPKNKTVVVDFVHEDSGTITIPLADAEESHERHMKEFFQTVLASGKSSMLSQEKYNKIMNYLRDPYNVKVSPQFKYWVTKERQISIAHQEEDGKTKEILVCSVPEFRRDYKQFSGISSLTVIPEQDLFKVTREIHADILHHAGYKKVLEYAQLRYYGLCRTYVQEFCKTCPVCQDKSLQPKRRNIFIAKGRPKEKKARHICEEIISADSLQDAVNVISGIDSAGFQTVVIEVQNDGEHYGVSSLSQSDEGETPSRILPQTPSLPDSSSMDQGETVSVVELEFMARVQVDLMDMSKTPDREFHYICHVMDHFSKYHILFPLKDRTPQEIATGLQVWVLAYFGPPRIIQSDAGRDSVHSALPLLMEQWPGNITLIKGKSTDKKTQAIMEQANQTIELELDSLRQELGLQENSSFHWAQYLRQIMYRLNTQKPSPALDTPYGVVFGKQPNATLMPGLGSKIISETQLEGLVSSLTGT